MPAPHPSTQRRALIVDTRPMTRRLWREALEGFGFTVTETDSGVTAVSVARCQTPDIIFLNRQLRDASGREVMGWLRSNPALTSTPIVMLGVRPEDAPPPAYAMATLSDPVSASAIQHVIEIILAARENSRLS